jgi:hypothetical protein
VAGILLVLLSLAALAWGTLPAGRLSRQATLSLPFGAAAGGIYKIQLSWPTWIRLGDSGVIRLVVEPGEQPGDAGDSLWVESRLEADGVEVFPAGALMEPLLPGRQAIFHWSVQPVQPGDRGVVVWVYVRSQPLQGGDSGGQALTAQKIVIPAVGLFGLQGQVVRLLGGIGLVVGLAFYLDIYLMRKSKRKEAGSSHA